MLLFLTLIFSFPLFSFSSFTLFFSISIIRILYCFSYYFHFHFVWFSRRICFCSLGFPRSLNGTKNATKDFLDEVNLLSDFLGDSRKEDGGTIQVAVPKVVPPPPPEIVAVSGGGGGGDVVDESASMKAKRDALQRKGAAAMIAAEEYARRLESGDVVVSFGTLVM